MSPLRQHMITALHLRGTERRTPASSVRDSPPAGPVLPHIPRPSLGTGAAAHFLHRKNVDRLAPASRRLCSSGLRFCSPTSSRATGHTLSLLRAPTDPPAPRRPAVWRRSGGASRRPRPGTTRSPAPPSLAWASDAMQPSACQGAAALASASRAMSPVAQGAKDRDVPLPAETLALLRTSWTHPSSPPLAFARPRAEHTPRPAAASPMRRPSVPGRLPHRPTTGPGAPHGRGSSLPCGMPRAPSARRRRPPRRIPRSWGPPTRHPEALPPPHPHGHAEAYERRHARRHGLLPCPPCARSAPPARRSSLRALLTLPPHPARSAAPSTRADADTTAPASLRANAGAGTTASLMPVATGTAPSGHSLHPRRGAPPPCGPTAAGAARAPPLHRPGDPPPLQPLASPPRVARPGPRRGCTLANGSPPTSGASGPTSRGAPRVLPTWGRPLPSHPPPALHGALVGASPADRYHLAALPRPRLCPGHSPLPHLPRALHRRHAPRRSAGAPRPPGLDHPLACPPSGRPPRPLRLHLPRPLCLQGRHRHHRLVLPARTAPVTCTARHVGRARLATPPLDVLRVLRRFLPPSCPTAS